MTDEAVDRYSILLDEQVQRGARIDSFAMLLHATGAMDDDVRDSEFAHAGTPSHAAGIANVPCRMSGSE